MSVPSSSAGAVTATFFTTSTVDGGIYVAKDVISPWAFVVVTVDVKPAKYNVSVVVVVVQWVILFLLSSLLSFLLLFFFGVGVGVIVSISSCVEVSTFGVLKIY